MASAECDYPPHKEKGIAYSIKAGGKNPVWQEIMDYSWKLQTYYNHLDTSEEDKQSILNFLFGHVGNGVLVKPGITFDLGPNIYMEDNCFLNFRVTILDWVPIYIGEGTMIGPNTNIYTVWHPYSPIDRLDYVLASNPMRIGKRVWLSGNVTLVGGITIGDYSIIGAGSIITKDIPSGVVVGGVNKIIRELKPEELEYHCEIP